MLKRHFAFILCVLFAFTTIAMELNQKPVLLLASSLKPLKESIESQAASLNLDIQFLCSSTIVGNIEEGALFDAAIVAKRDWRGYLKKSVALAVTEFPFASNGLILAGSKEIGSVTLRDLLVSNTTIIVANKDSVPLGEYSYEALNNAGYIQPNPLRILSANSANEALVFLQQGKASYAILFLSDAKYVQHNVQLSNESHSPIEYMYLANNNSRHDKALKQIFFSPAMHNALLENNFKVVARK